MYQDERKFDFHGLGLALKKAREERGWTQAYVAELVGKTDRTIMNIENKGQHPSFNLFFKLVTMFDISVDQFFYKENQRGGESCRKHIDVMLNAMNEKELVVMEATAEGLKKARVSLNGKQFLRGHRWHGGRLLGPAPNPEPRAILARSGSVALLLIFTVSIAPVLSFCPARRSPADNQCLLSPC